jgi:flagellar L-ring protein FlgH
MKNITKNNAGIVAGLASLGLTLAALTGCAAVDALNNAVYKPHAAPAPKIPLDPEAKTSWKPAPISDGSLWSANSGSVFTDVKAYHPGDIVLVNVSQSNTGTKSADTASSRDATASASVNHFFGLENSINSLTGYTKAAKKSGIKNSSSSWSPVPLVDGSSSNSYTGKGSTDRTDTLTATVSAVVSEVLPNGNLVIYGHQAVTINHECSMLTVQGIVRPTDIASDNIVDSDRLANADIQFTGSGVVSDKQHVGWGTRFMDWVMPF